MEPMPQRHTGPVTREHVRAHATAQADDPMTLGEVVHEEFNADAESGGFAFRPRRHALHLRRRRGAELGGGSGVADRSE